MDEGKNLYVTTQGASVKKEKGAILVTFGSEELACTPINSLKLLVIFGNIQVTTQALSAMLDAGVDVAFMTQNGHFKGKVTAANTKNCLIRRQQHIYFSDPAKALTYSKEIVKAKFENGIGMLNAYHRNENNPFVFDRKEEFEKFLTEIDKATTLEQLLGYEGYAAKIYFEEFAKCFTGEIKFPGRQYFPSRDPINALLSFGYSFMAREMQAVLEAESLDPYIGFYHQLTYGRASLSLDLIEPFRHGLIDRLVLKLINKEMLTAEDFEPGGEQGGLYLKKESLPYFIKAYEEAASKENLLYKQVEMVPFRKVFWQVVENLKQTINGDAELKAWRE